MRPTAIGLWLLSVAALPAAAEINTFHFDDFEDLAPWVLGGQEFVSRADTAAVSTRRIAPPLEVSVPYALWEDDVPRGFSSVYNPTGTPVGTTVDTAQAIIEAPETVPIDAGTNGLLITVYADNPTDSVTLNNLQITPPGAAPMPIADSATVTGGVHYLLIRTDLNLSEGYILSGAVNFDWSGGLPAAGDQWFEVTPAVVVPEPAGVWLCVAGLGLATGLLRRR